MGEILLIPWANVVMCAALWLLAGCAPATRLSPAPSCSLSAADSAWVERALAAWRFSVREITHIQNIENFRAILFDEDCIRVSANALSNDNFRDVLWTATSHSGAIGLPDGEEMPASVTSFTSASAEGAYFVMAVPSVWRSGGVPGGPLGLETLMVAVLLHEGSHVAQSPTYGARITDLAQRYALPESFNDDSVQERFGAEPQFTSSIARETDLFFEAAQSQNDDAARELAREARALMKARAQRWYVGADSYFGEAEDLWLTFEGAGQWVGYQWLVSPAGANVSRTEAMAGFARRSRWWSQNEGLAIALTLDRLGATGWPRQAFGAGERTLLEMLDAALAEG